VKGIDLRTGLGLQRDVRSLTRRSLSPIQKKPLSPGRPKPIVVPPDSVCSLVAVIVISKPSGASAAS